MMNGILCPDRFVLLIVAAALFACDGGPDKPEQAETLRPVRSMTVISQSELLGREFTGVVDADRKVELTFRVPGKLQAFPVLEGDAVEAGQLIARLDPTDYQIQLSGIEAEFERARSEFERAETLIARQLIAEADHEKLKAQFTVAQAELARARQELEYTVMRAPFAGIIANRYVENFSEVTTKDPIVSLADLSTLTVEIDVPESIMIRIRRHAERPDLFASFEGIEEETFPLIIKETAAQADPTTRTYAVTLSMAASDEHNILPGMSATVGVRPFSREGKAAELIYLPAQAVLEDGQGRFVYLLDAGADGTGVVRRRAVEVGDLTSLGLQIIDGLSDGDRVITAGWSRLADGMRVRAEGERG